MKLTENRLSIKQKSVMCLIPQIFLQLTAGEYWDLISAAYELDTKKEKRLAELTALLICIVIKMKQSQVFHMECVKNDFDRHVAARSRYLGIG